jgi:HK97 family phage major capsid protein
MGGVTSNRSIILKDAVVSGDFKGTGKGGYLNPAQSREFLRQMFDATAFLKDIQTIQMRTPTQDLDYIGMNKRVLRPAAEGVAPSGLVGIATSKQQLEAREVILPFDITDNVLEDTIERENADDTIAAMMSEQFGNDLCDLSINGDTAATGADENFLKIGNGFIQIAKASTDTHKVNTGGLKDYKDMIFPSLLNALPNRYKRRKTELRFFVSPTVAEAYTKQLSLRDTALGDESLITGNLQRYAGIPIFECEYMPDDVLILTSNKNLATGIFREVRVEKERSPRKRLTEYTTTMRLDPAKIIWHEALVIGYKISDIEPVEPAPIKVEVTNIDEFPTGG